MARRRADLTPKGEITEFGRRVLMRQVMLTRDGNVGVKALSAALGINEATVMVILQNRDENWHLHSEWLEIVSRLCELLKVDHSWLVQTMDYGDMGSLEFRLARRRVY